MPRDVEAKVGSLALKRLDCGIQIVGIVTDESDII
jgi:hypothetical protein